MSLRIGFVGAGWAAHQHAQSLAALGERTPVVVTDTDTGRCADFATRWGASVAVDVDELAYSGLDAAVVTTPTGLHAQAVAPLLQAGVAVFVEKPLAVSPAHARELTRVAAHTGVPIAVGYQWRAAPVLDRLRAEIGDSRIALLASQGIGITQARSWFTDPRLSSGLIGERGSHHLDLHGHLGGPIVEVRAVRGTVRTSGAAAVGGEDVLTVVCTHETGAISTTLLVWASEQHIAEQSVRVVSERGNHVIRLDPEFALSGGRLDRRVDVVGSGVPFVLQLARFLRAVRSCDPADVFCSAGEGAATVLAVDAALQSLQSGDAVAVDRL